MVKERMDPLREDSVGPEARYHLDRYRLAALLLSGDERVADAACGLGYGRSLLEATGAHVTGFDRDAATLAEARSRYPGTYVELDLDAEVPTGFDFMTCFETVEHLEDPERFISRLAIPIVVFSAPVIPSTHFNPYHRHDFTADELRTLVRTRYNIIEELDQDSTYLALVSQLR